MVTKEGKKIGTHVRTGGSKEEKTKGGQARTQGQEKG